VNLAQIRSAIPEIFDRPSKLAEKMPFLSLATLTFAFYLDIQTGDQTRFPVNLTRAGQHRAHLQLMDTGRGEEKRKKETTGQKYNGLLYSIGRP